jgi:hypothetical protein
LSVEAMQISLQYLEIFHEKIYDLLEPRSTAIIKIKEDRRTGVYVHGLTNLETTTAEGMYEAISQGTRHRHIGATESNERSSRSHSICTIHI